MTTKDFSTTILVDQLPMEVFNAISNPRGWWSENIEGETNKLNNEFQYRYQDVHRCRIKVTELVPGEKVVWHVLDNYFSFTLDKAEWIDTKLIFEISRQGETTQLVFTHAGLVPAYECFEVCEEAWTNYIQNSLRNLIVNGQGTPNPNEGGYNAKVAEKFNLEQRMK